MHSDPSSAQAPQSDSRLSSAALSGEALARRRALIKGLGKGTAALAVVTPIQTLAVPTIIGGTKLCTVSGVYSNVLSRPPGTVTTCSGNSPTSTARCLTGRATTPAPHLKPPSSRASPRSVPS